jgi:hypothetical protein
MQWPGRFYIHVSDRTRKGSGRSRHLPKIGLSALEQLFRHRVLRMLLRERRIDDTVIRTLLGWRHSGFSLHNAVRIGAHDSDGRRPVSEYILRSPFSQERLRYHTTTGTVLYHSKMHPVLKRNFEVFSACDWLAALTAHIPNAGEHLVRDPCAVRKIGDIPSRTAQAGGESEEGRRPAPLGRVPIPRPAGWVRGEGRALARRPARARAFPANEAARAHEKRDLSAAEYGWYSNVNRGKRRKAQGEEPSGIEEVSEVASSAAKRAWARLIKQVYEVDPLVCPRCAGPMRVLAFIEQPEVIEKILTHLALWPAPAHSPPVRTLAA